MAAMDISASIATSSAASGKQTVGATSFGDFNVSGGGGKNTMTLYIAAAVVALVVIAFLWRKK